MLQALLAVLVAQCHALHIAKPAPTAATAKCPDGASLANDTNNVLFWGMILDGKDHKQGKDAYNWHGFEQAYNSLKFLLTEKPNEPLDFDHLMKARHICCDDPKGGGSFGWAGMGADHYEQTTFRAYTCLECSHMKALINDVPQEFLKIGTGKNKNHKKNPAACPDYSGVYLQPKPVERTKEKMKELLTAYNTDVKDLKTKEEKLARLASYLKDFAFLHPWGNGNGRFRTLQLVHEIRRLGLGCGALMYNNNKDLYFITKELYTQKIAEGIEMYNKAMDTGKSPWVDDQVVAAHRARFSPDITMPGFSKCHRMDYKRGSYWPRIPADQSNYTADNDDLYVEELE